MIIAGFASRGQKSQGPKGHLHFWFYVSGENERKNIFKNYVKLEDQQKKIYPSDDT